MNKLNNAASQLESAAPSINDRNGFPLRTMNKLQDEISYNRQDPLTRTLKIRWTNRSVVYNRRLQNEHVTHAKAALLFSFRSAARSALIRIHTYNLFRTLEIHDAMYLQGLHCTGLYWSIIMSGFLCSFLIVMTITLFTFSIFRYYLLFYRAFYRHVY